MDLKLAYKTLGLKTGADQGTCLKKFKKNRSELERSLSECDSDSERAKIKKKLGELQQAYQSILLNENAGSLEGFNSLIDDEDLEAVSGDLSEEAGEDDEKSTSKAINSKRKTEVRPIARAPKNAVGATTSKKISEPKKPAARPNSGYSNGLNSKKIWEEPARAKNHSPKSMKTLYITLGVVAFLVILLTSWKIFISIPNERSARHDAIEAVIASLEDQSNDETIGRVRKQVNLYATEAPIDYASNAQALLAHRVKEIEHFREQERKREQAERRERLRTLRSEIKELEKQAAWLNDQVTFANKADTDIQAKLSQSDGGLREAYLKERLQSFDGYRRWINRFDRDHPIHSSLQNAKRYMNSGSLQKAEESLLAAKKSSNTLDEQIARRRVSLYGDRLLRWIQKPENRSAIEWLRQEDPRLITAAVSRAKDRLSRLDEYPATKNSLQELEKLAFLATEADPDYQRWYAKILPDLIITSDPTGATLFDSESAVLGTTPHKIEDLEPDVYTYQIMKNGYKSELFTFEARLNLDDRKEEFILEALADPKVESDFIAQLPGGQALPLKFIEKATFMMGSPDDETGRNPDEPLHQAKVTKWYWIGKKEVNQAEWESLMGTDWKARYDTENSLLDLFDPEYPIHSVSWEDAMEFCRRLTAYERENGRISEQFEYRLPTEAEWELACRAGTETPFHYGDTLTAEDANFDGLFPYNSDATTASSKGLRKVGSYQPNAWGLYDMHGNVWEWCLEDYNETPKTASTNGDLAANSSGEFVCRGGSWFSSGANCRSANRSRYPLDYAQNTLGFRVVLYPLRDIELLETLRQRMIATDATVAP